jgi:aldose 1-epimerase
MKIQKQEFGNLADGSSVDLYTLENDHGNSTTITNYGGIVVTLMMPDRNGKRDDIVLGYPTLEQYVANNPFFGTLVGRYGNRIAKGRFVLNGREYILAHNDGENHLHGGLKGFDKVVWKTEEFQDEAGVGLKLTYVSPEGEEGYPGTLQVTVLYTLTNNNALKIEYSATTDQDTVVNLTHHSYFNLLGALSGKDILGHEVLLNANQFTPVNQGLIPTGELRNVQRTSMDFRQSTAIGGRIHDADEQISFAGGYDHNWVLNREEDSLLLAASVYEPTTGRVMDVHTTEPGIQFYTGNFLDKSYTGKGDIPYFKHAGFCLEAQHFPDSPNHPEFPSTLLKPGEEYTQTTVYTFSVK